MAFWSESPRYKEYLTICYNASSSEIEAYLEDVHKIMLLLKENVTKHIHDADSQNNSIEGYLENLHKKMLVHEENVSEHIYDADSQNNSEAINSKKIEGTCVARAWELYQNCVNVIEATEAAEKVILSKWLLQWQHQQVLAGNGGPLSMKTLDDIQSWFEKLCIIINGTRSSIEEVYSNKCYFPLDFEHTFQAAYNAVIQQLKKLIVSAFIVEKQPPQVIKKNTRFSATVRHLIPNLGFANSSVQVSILSESQAKAQQQSNAILDQSSGKISPDTGMWVLDPLQRRLVCNLSKMNLTDLKRGAKKGDESVMDEKFALFFQSNIQIDRFEFSVWAMSVAVVLIVHGIQEPSSLATITWDNAFSQMARVPFHVVDRVYWSQMAIALNMKFSDETGRELSPANLDYLCRKATNSNFNSNDQSITLHQISKQKLHAQTFTFWEWFYAAMKLTKHHFRDPWCANLVIGFIDKQEAARNLLNCKKPGTFLLRFSDSVLGGISIAYLDDRMNVVNVQPFVIGDLVVKSLVDRIKDLAQCSILYPDIPKDQVFREYYSPTIATKNSNGYVIPILKMSVTVPENHHLSSPVITQHGNWQSFSNDTNAAISEPITWPIMHPNYPNHTSSVPSMLPNLDANDGKRQRFM